MNSTNSSNMLPLVKKGRCEGCNEVTKDHEVLHCYLCKNRFHVANCTVIDTLESDALPCYTNLTSFSKFSAKTYSTGTFIWTCFRCGVVKELSSSDNINQRVSLLESLLITLSPALMALTKSGNIGNDSAIAKALSDIRANTPGAAGDSPASDTFDHSADTQPPSPAGDLVHQNDAGNNQNDVGNNVINLNSIPTVATDHAVTKLTKGAKFKVKVSSKKDGDSLRTCFHRAHSAGKIGSYAMRYHSNSRADMLFDNLDDADLAYDCIASEMNDVDVDTPTCMRTKMVHLVGLTQEDTTDSVYRAICKPGRNHCIEHLVNPCSLRVLSVSPCNKNHQVYRASIVISEDIWDIILNKMHKKLKVDYLSCSVFLRPESVRCYKCQRLGHVAQSCKNETTCVVCGEGHNSKDCKNAPHCVNCAESDLDIRCDHGADSPDCFSYKNYRKQSAKN